MTISIHPMTRKARQITPEGTVDTVYLPAGQILRDSVGSLVDGYLTTLEVTDPDGQHTTFWFNENGARTSPLNLAAMRLWSQITGFPAVFCPERMCGTVVATSTAKRTPQTVSATEYGAAAA